jgi:hypothetical protein
VSSSASVSYSPCSSMSNTRYYCFIYSSDGSLVHSTVHRKLRCLLDSSSDEGTTPPNVSRAQTIKRAELPCGSRDGKSPDDSSTATAIPPHGFQRTRPSLVGLERPLIRTNVARTIAMPPQPHDLVTCSAGDATTSSAAIGNASDFAPHAPRTPSVSPQRHCTVRPTPRCYMLKLLPTSPSTSSAILVPECAPRWPPTPPCCQQSCATRR